MPEKLEPMLARSGDAPARRRALGLRDQVGRGAGARLRRGRPAAAGEPQRRDITPRYPELRELGRALGSHEAVLDGEVVAFGPDGKPSFQRLQGRMHLASENAVRRMCAARAGDLRDLRPAVPRRALADGVALRGAARAAGRARAQRPGMADARPSRRRRRGAARGHADAGAGGRHRQAARLPVRARPPHAGVGEGQELPPRRRRRRRLAAGRGQPRRGAWARWSSACTTTTASLQVRRPRRHGVRPARARPPGSAAGRPRSGGRRRSRDASRRRPRTSCGPSSWRRSSTRSGRRPGRCASPPTRGCATTWIRWK